MFDTLYTRCLQLPQFFLTAKALTHVQRRPQRERPQTSPEVSDASPGFSAGNPAWWSVEVRMDSLVNQLARELTEAISAAVSRDAKVEACREKARAAGLDMRVTLEAVVGFVDREKGRTKGSGRKGGPRSALEMSANDRRFLKSLRISADETTPKEVE
jgi:hypothetical protein